MKEIPFKPLKGRGSAHVQTLWAYLVQSVPSVKYRREDIPTPDDDVIVLDWADAHPNAPILVIHHGLEGHSRAPYVRRLAAFAQSQGYGVVAMNARGCGGSPNLGVESYHAAWTRDIEHVVDLIIRRFPEREIALVGYSLGASQMANFLGRKGSDVPGNVKAAYLVSAPISLVRAIGTLDRGLNRMYAAKFLNSLRVKLLKKAVRHPEVRARALKGLFVGSVRAFDSLWTAPVHGFGTGDAYYAESSCENWLPSITVPTTFLHAKDDPLIPWNAVVGDWMETSPQVSLEWTEKGGHVGFAEMNNEQWLEEQIISGLKALGFGRMP